VVVVVPGTVAAAVDTEAVDNGSPAVARIGVAMVPAVVAADTEAVDVGSPAAARTAAAAAPAVDELSRLSVMSIDTVAEFVVVGV